MNRHSLIARFGLKDRKPIDLLQPDSQLTRIDFVGGNKRFEHGLDIALDQLASFGLCPTERAFDLLVIAAMVFAADTRISRTSEAQDGWTREVHLYVPVSDPALWQNSQDLIARMLRFLTGDRWRFVFRSRPNDFNQIVPQASQSEFDKFSGVSLFSGGLDSFIGALDLLKAGKRPLLVSHYWDGMTSQHQKTCFAHLERRFPKVQLRHMRVRVGFENKLVKLVRSEDTQRSRSFLFFALGSLAASGMSEGALLHVPENGLISLNVPLDALRLGALSTRTSHPFFMACFNTLLRDLELPVQLFNPYRHKTKGEMVTECLEHDFLKGVAKDTMSCSAETKGRYQGDPPSHCGYCVPCLIRRASMQQGFGKDDTAYGVGNLTAHPLRADKAQGRNVRSVQLLLARLRANPQMAKTLIHKPGPLTDFPDEISSYERVFYAGMEELRKIVQNVTTRTS
jgi:7-cyano-7-deazaguanine synthase in queuosine biosynthesis